MRPDLQQLFNAFSEGFLLADAQGNVRFANDAARQLSGVLKDERIESESLNSLLRWAADGYVSLPGTVVAARDVTASVHCSPNAGEYAVVLRAAPGEPRADWDRLGHLLIGSLVDEIAVPAGVAMTALDFARSRLGQSDRAHEAVTRLLQRRCTTTRERLERVVERLRATARRSPVPDRGTAVIGRVVRAAVSALETEAAGRGIRVELDIGRVEQCEVEGNAFWLEWALVELISEQLQAECGGNTVSIVGRSNDTAVALRVAREWPAGHVAEAPESAGRSDHGGAVLSRAFIGQLLALYGGALRRATGERAPASAVLRLLRTQGDAEPVDAEVSDFAVAAAARVIARARAAGRATTVRTRFNPRRRNSGRDQP